MQKRSDHIEEFLAMGPTVCSGLTKLVFDYSDVSYAAHNSNTITTGAVNKLAKACPKLKKVSLPDNSSLGDVALTNLLARCPHLTHVELSGRRGSITSEALDAIRENPEWAPNLKKLRIGGSRSSEKQWLKEMRDLTRARPNLVVDLVSTSERKKYGDWEVETYHTSYKKGREVKSWLGSYY